MPVYAVSSSLACLTDLKSSIRNSTTNFQHCPLLSITYWPVSKTDLSLERNLIVVIYNSSGWKREDQNKPTSSVEADTTGGSSLSSHALPKLEVSTSPSKTIHLRKAILFGGAIDKLVVNEPFEVALNERKGSPLILFVTDIEKCRAGNIDRRLTTAKTDMGDLISMLNQEVAIFTLSAVPLQIMPTALRECFSVLKPGGMLLFRDYGINQQITMLLLSVIVKCLTVVFHQTLYF
ncbi:hypothetical protein Gotri_019349 [Gossypium trilobum]|uniref:Uncharacterized protein n=1 Tax=Gossypium trilobum TaxID=34281 RepID=A0A7J9ECY9_9ROSI|nr:hypothetical protein [Gossypium trilobum]